MRNKLFLLGTIMMLLFPCRAIAQGVLQKNYPINGDEHSISELLSQITDYSGVSFSYNSRLFNGKQKLQIPAGTYPLQDLLGLIFRNQAIDFIIKGEHVILKPMVFSSGTIHLKGQLLDSASHLPIMGATVYLPELQKGAISDSLGYFNLYLQPGVHEMRLSRLSYKPKNSRVLLPYDTAIAYYLIPDTVQMQELIVNSEQQNRPVKELAIGKEKLDIESIKSMPAMFGEVDVLKSIQMLPGIQSSAEGQSGLLVRGGSADQTLVMLNDATIYSPSHVLGFFSVFNPEAIKDVEVYKGGIPARWGGRLASVVNNHTKKGNDEAYAISGGVGLISSRLSIEGPILKNKASFLVTARRTYLDILLKIVPEQDVNSTSLYFYDFNTSLHYKINDNNQLHFISYNGQDVASFYDFLQVHWGNRVFSGEWLHTFNTKLLLSTSFQHSAYGYGFNIDAKDELQLAWSSRLRENSGRLDFDYAHDQNNQFSFGYNATRRTFSPVLLDIQENNTLSGNIRLDEKHVVEQALYIQHEHQLNDRLSFLYGLRYSAFHNIGPGRVFIYQDDQPKSLSSISDTLQYGSNKIMHSYHGAEPRFITRYSLTPASSLKFSYNRMRQYTQVASSATASLPTDRWIPSDAYIKPQLGDQWSAGYFREIKKAGIDLSAEVYYKLMRNQIDFRDGISLLDNLNNESTDIQFNNALETQLLSGRAWSYGLELMLKKKEGRFNGWVSYTLSRTQRQINGINQHKPYSPRYDRPHDLNIVASYQLKKRVKFSTNWVFISGSAVTLPEGKYSFEGSEFPYYNPNLRNNQRLPDYHRLDLSLTLQNKKNEERRWQSDWSFTVYNAYMRKNPLFVQFADVINNDPSLDEVPAEEVHSRELKGIQFFFSIIPSVSYNFRF